MGSGGHGDMAGVGVKVYLDENVDIRVTDALLRRGYDAAHALHEGNRRIADEQHLYYATLHGRAVVTHNFADYARLHADFVQRGELHEGIILIPVRPLSELLVRLSKHLDTYTPAEQHNNLLWA